MKTFLNLLFFTLFTTTSYSQVGVNTSFPSSSSILDAVSTTKGILIPRMTSDEREAIVNPVVGLLIFNTDTNCFNYYTSKNKWFEICGV